MSASGAVIEWKEPDANELSSRFPHDGLTEGLFGARLIVRPLQAAVLVCDGRGLDVFGQGRFTLAAGNLPGIMKMRSLLSDAEVAGAVEIHFINLGPLAGRLWETAEPVAYRDGECGMVRFLTSGTYSLQIREPLLFLNTVAGAYGSFSGEHGNKFIQSMIVSRICDYLGGSVRSLVDLPRHYEVLWNEVNTRLALELAEDGVAFLDLSISRLILPEHVQKMVDERAGMKAVGDFEQFFKYCPPKMSRGNALSGSDAEECGGLAPEQSAVSRLVHCPACRCVVARDSRLCRSCGHWLVAVKKCPRCHTPLASEDRFCRICGSPEDAVLTCSACEERLPHGAKFCISCGEQVAAPA